MKTPKGSGSILQDRGVAMRYSAFSFILGCLIIVPFKSEVFGEGTELVPIWSIEIQDGRPVLTKNDFERADRRGQFPLETLTIQKKYVRSDARSPVQGRLVALLEIGESGRQKAMSPFVDGNFLSLGRYETRRAIFVESSDENLRTSGVSDASFISCAEIEKSALVSWQRAPNGAFAVFVTNTATFLVDTESSTTLLRYPGRTSYMAISRDSRAVATVNTEHAGESPDRFVRPPTSSKLVIFKYDGDVIYESLPSSSHYWHPFVTPNGRYLIVGQVVDPKSKPYGSSYKLVVLDIIDGGGGSFRDLPFGVPFFSADGSHMAYINADCNVLWYCNISNPNQPEVMWEYREFDVISSVAVSENGNYIAVDARKKNELDQKRLFVMDANKTVLQSCSDSEINGSWGVMYAGEYLIKGVKNHVAPAYADSEPTTRIDIFSVERGGDR